MRHSVALLWEGDTSTQEDDATLVRAAQVDPAAFAHIYARYRHRVYAYVRGRLPSEEDAADVTQYVFLRALDALPRYRSRTAPLSAWLFRIARNAVTDVQRRQHPASAWEGMAGRIEAQADQNQDVEAQVLQREAVARLHALLRALDPDTRDLLMLRFAAGLTSAEIGVVIDKSHAATRKRLARAIHSLKEQYDEPIA